MWMNSSHWYRRPIPVSKFLLLIEGNHELYILNSLFKKKNTWYSCFPHVVSSWSKGERDEAGKWSHSDDVQLEAENVTNRKVQPVLACAGLSTRCTLAAWCRTSGSAWLQFVITWVSETGLSGQVWI